MANLDIRLLQWNIQGFLCHKYALEELVAKYKPNIIALQETHIIHRNIDFLHLPGYKTFHHNKNFNYAKSGIAILVSNNLNVTSFSVSNCELLFQSVTINYSQPITITNIYREQDITLEQNLINQIEFRNIGHHMIIGDFNSQNTVWGSSSNSRSGNLWVNFAEDRGLVVLNDGSPTLLSTRNTLTSIDVSMCNSDLAPQLSWYCLDTPPTGDHIPIFITSNFSTHNTKFTPKFILKKADWQLFHSKLSTFNDSFQETNNINKEAAQIGRLFRKAANESIPISRKPPEKRKPVWFNSTISRLIAIRQKAWKTFKRVRTQENCISYRRACAIVKRECKIAKRLTWTNFLNSLNPFLDVQTLWNKVNKLRRPKTPSFPTIITTNGTISDPREIASQFASFWSTLSSDSAFDSEVIASKQNLEISALPSVLASFPELTQEVKVLELNRVLQTLKGSTPSLDKISYPMVKNAPTPVKERLCRLYTLIIKSGLFPHSWKIAVLIPIPKPGNNQSHLQGYRPISLLPVLSKILEKIIACRLCCYTSNYISKIQHAFLPRHGVHTLWHQLEAELRRNTNNRKHSLVMSADLEKAFDRVTRTQIILELNSWGINQDFLNLLLSFLSNRRIIVKIDGHFSNAYTLDNGIPQGSPLSVILYNIYVNSLAKAIEDQADMDFVGIYADNIYAICSGAPEDVEIKLNNLDHTIQVWAKHTGAIIPHSKTEFLHICNKRNCQYESFRLAEQTIPVATSMRILGIIFTRNLLWNEHIKFIISKLDKINNLLRLICSKKKGPHIDTAVTICNSLVTGILSHGITLYGWTSKTNMDKIDVATNKCFRTATGLLRSTPISSLRVEGRFSEFSQLHKKFCVNLASRAITLPSDGLHNNFWNQIASRNSVPSSLSKILNLLLQYNITLPSAPAPPNNTTTNLIIDDSLSFFSKDITDPHVYKTLLADKISSYSPQTILYTDGSFDGISTSFSVVRQISTNNFETICQRRLPDRIGVFSAELAAVISAMTQAADLQGKTLICSDSLSVIRAIRTNRKGIFNHILRAFAINAVILWIPSHIGIAGNERADEAAKQALNLSLISEPPPFPYVISTPFKHILKSKNIEYWNNSEVFLKSVNPWINRPLFNENLSRSECIFLARLRVNKAIFNTKHYYDYTDPARCQYCNVLLSVSHILSECPASRIEDPIVKILDCSTKNFLGRIRNSLRNHGNLDV